MIGNHGQAVGSLTMPMTPFMALISASFQLSGAAADWSCLPGSQIPACALCTGEWQRRGVDHARQLHVDGVLRRAVDLERGVAARHGLADQAEILAFLELFRIDRGSVAGIVPKAAISP
jgi:hypothetical protein